MKPRLLAAGAGLVTVVGAIAAFPLLFPGPSVSVDGGQPAPYQLPDGGPWAIDPDGGNQPLNCPPGVTSCTEMLAGGGYAEVLVSVGPDGGNVYGALQPCSQGCASDAGPCTWVADGGPVPSTGSYPFALMQGGGCLRRCAEMSGWSGAPQGCQP